MADDMIDMTQFESQFSGQLSAFMDDGMFEKVESIRQRMADLTDILSWKKEFLQFADANIDKLEELQRGLQEVIDAIRARKQPYSDEKREIRQDMLQDERKLAALQREWARLMAELDAQRKFNEQRLELDAKTSDALWRSRALPHQFEGAYRLSSAQRAILGDKPGLGKTLQAIMTIDMLRGLGLARKVLIVCPKPVIDGFEREFAKWSPGQFVATLNQTLKGLKSEILDLAALMPEAVILTNYEVWRKDKGIIDKLIGCQFDTVILDEAHNLKDSKSVTAKGIKAIVHAENKCEHCSGLTFGAACPKCGQWPTKEYANRSVKNLFPMTGTPILNRPQDLFVMLNLVDDRAFPSESRFLEDFCTKKCAVCGGSFCQCAEKPKWIWKFTSGGEAQLLKRLGMRFTARTRESADVKMPPQEIRHHKLTFDPEMYPKLGDNELTALETLAWYTRMRQSATWPDGIKIRNPDTGEVEFQAEVGESIIMDEGELIIREALDCGNRIVVFSHFKEALKEMERRLVKDGVSVIRYDGDLNAKLRIEAQHDFDLTITRPENSKYQVMLAQYKTAKVGLNLHGAQEVLFLDREWNPGMEQQAGDRVRRIGSELDTIVHVLHAEGTATELMDALLDEKASMMEGFETEVNLHETMRKFLGGN
jgi:SNF2 family DNA or RNA helicase